MRLSLKEIENLTLEQVKTELYKNETNLDKLYQLDNKNVAFYSREVFETEMNIFNLRIRLEQGESK